MKRWVTIVSCVAVVVAVAVWQSRGRSVLSAPSLDAGLILEPRKALGVEEFIKGVDSHRNGAVLVEGVVSAVSPDNHLLALIDTGEFQKCGGITCAQLTLPVRWSGPMPLEREIVRVQGAVQETDGKLIFVAQGLEKVGSQGGGS